MHVCVYNFVILTHEKNLHKLLREEKIVPSTYYQDVNMKCSNNAQPLHGKKIDSKSSKIWDHYYYSQWQDLCSKKSFLVKDVLDRSRDKNSSFGNWIWSDYAIHMRFTIAVAKFFATSVVCTLRPFYFRSK